MTLWVVQECTTMFTDTSKFSNRSSSLIMFQPKPRILKVYQKIVPNIVHRAFSIHVGATKRNFRCEIEWQQDILPL